MTEPDYITPPPGLLPEVKRDDSASTEMRRPRSGRESFSPFVVARGGAGAPTTYTPPEDADSAPQRSGETRRAAAGEPERHAPEPALVASGGHRIVLDRPVVIGRDPDAESHDGARAEPVDDPNRSVSKTHALVVPHERGAVVTDLHSTNGVLVRSVGGAERALPAGEAQVVDDGSTVLLGSFELRLEADRAE